MLAAFRQWSSGCPATPVLRPKHTTTLFQSKAMSEAQEQEVQVETHGSCAVVTLNRPKALNSLNTPMVERLLDLYRTWDASPNPAMIVLKGAGGKAFCAGGDVRKVVELRQAGDEQEAARFFRSEYNMNFALSQLSKPHVALLDGITMGGGVGVSVHGDFRVATEKTLFAMPELAIGLFPDVGASYFLSRLPGMAGLHLALTGTRLKGAQVKEIGIATHYVPSAAIPEIQAQLTQMGEAGRDRSEVDKLLRGFEEPATSELMDKLPLLNGVFGKDSLLKVVAALDTLAQTGDNWARETLDAICKGSPFSAHVTFELIRRGAHLPLSQCLEMEFGLARNFTSRSCYGADFAEGVRAVLVDKDNAPKWRHATLDQVPLDEVQAVFTPLPEGERLGLVDRHPNGGPVPSAL
mmetsp:Transcript_33988/g.96290  ORF Transcript_33988/g.96290 Transcript_33988/m.96290 type:complete len:408 (-) Transcript_33988:387-1610(-)